ncbi:MAG: bifunctional isocitrate dehydrogenase kinase/phosphatase, partial [Actinobacteria bacterium]
DPDDVSVLFSYTHSEFVVRVPDPAGMIGFLRRLIPHRRPAEMYNAIGFRKHGKTELYRDLSRHLAQTDDRFENAPGTPGLVMIVFTLSGYDVVFKVIRDRFPPQKTVTPDQVRARYTIVSRHDRAGRLIDAIEFRKLAFAADRFEAGLLRDLLAEAGRTVSLVGGQVHFSTVYVERKVTPLDVFLRLADDDLAAAAIIDYGTAIKNLAATNIFPGDMLIKNFGVTRSGRVVFYDYDELSLLTERNFREMPVSDDPDDEMASTPWFGVGEGDIFPEEFRSFLGVSPRLRAIFETTHGDLYGVEFWHRIQDRIKQGETIPIFPYRRQVALHARGG